MSSGKGLTLVKTTLLPGQERVTVVASLPTNPSCDVRANIPIGMFESPKCDVNPQPNTRGIGPLVGRTSGYRRSVIHVLAVIFSITDHFSFICQYIFIRVKWSGREICPLLMYPSNFFYILIINENTSSGKGLTLVKTTLLPGQHRVTVVASLPTNLSCDVTANIPIQVFLYFT